MGHSETSNSSHVIYSLVLSTLRPSVMLPFTCPAKPEHERFYEIETSCLVSRGISQRSRYILWGNISLRRCRHVETPAEEYLIHQGCTLSLSAGTLNGSNSVFKQERTICNPWRVRDSRGSTN